MSKTSITFWRGLRTIGGNIAEICYGNDRVIFDFGFVYDAVQTVSSHPDRTNTFVLDKLKISAIPHIDGIYGQDDLQGSPYNITKPVSFEDSIWNTSVFISHLHLDHMGAIDTLSNQLPIYMSNDSKQLYDTLNKIGESLHRNRDVRGFIFNTPIQLGNITITPYRVDHDILGASSFLIETPDATILNSGDIRMHGEHPEWNKAWMGEMAQKEIDILLMEGTTFFPNEKDKSQKLCQSEQDIPSVISQLLIETKGLVTFNIYHRNIDRLQHILNASKYANRTAVLELETAYIADQFLKDPSFVIYRTAEPKTNWQKALTEKYKQITADDINEQPNQYFLQNSYDRILNLLDLNLENGLYLHSNGMPLGKFDPAYFTMHSFLEMLNMQYEALDVSGHATRQDVLSIIEQVKPNVLIPWHSFHPELIKPINKKQAVFLPNVNTTYRIEKNRLVPVQ